MKTLWKLLSGKFPEIPRQFIWSTTQRQLNECVIAFGIPAQITTKVEFEQFQFACHDTDHTPFICNKNWETYQHFINQVNQTESILTQFGVKIIRDLKFEEFGNLFESYQVIVLFSHNDYHNDQDAIEFQAMPPTYSVFQNTDSLIDQILTIPSNKTFSGFFDLSVCNPNPATLATIRNELPNCVVHAVRLDLDAHRQLYYYLCLFQHMYHGASYLEATEKLAMAFLE